jgi:hypothetical protein
MNAFAHPTRAAGGVGLPGALAGVQHLAGVGTGGQQRVVAELAGVAMGGALLVVAVNLADRGVRIDGHRAVSRSGACLPRPGQHGLGEPVELADVPEAEHAQERADGGGRHHPVAEHAGGRPGAQHLDVVDAVATSEQAVHQMPRTAGRSIPSTGRPLGDASPSPSG